MAQLIVNGRHYEVAVPDPAIWLLYVLRNDLGLSGPKFGCGLGQCWSCTVLVNGIPVRSCVMSTDFVEGKAITTLEGLGTPEAPHPVQQAFLEEQAMQCGYCANGMILAAAALIDSNPNPSDQEIAAALDRHLCRCGSHGRILRAVRRAAEIARQRIAG